ncbi:uncharacterized protein DDB_G0283697-like [Bactrocera neohumeralis]|uniref:uncharacterized protein DDB_G0283697-like n=1 Tax=Bactrocera neohumeralis TaxID=98809 RepID=UPI0021659D00|nr:uncharacterized protein DDB_G0283697-like [Bactrocera neohumeralis]
MENNSRNNTNNIYNEGGILMSSRAENSRSEADLTVRTPNTEVDPFKRVSRIARSPNQTPTISKPVRARSSPPMLEDSTPQAKVAQHPGDYFSELGSAIKRLTEAMHPPQRSINNNMRDILSSIAKLYSKALEEHTKIIEVRRKVQLRTTNTETTPKRPREKNQPKRKTPPKRNKTAHEEAPKNQHAERSKEISGNSPDKSKKEGKKDDGWVSVKRKPQSHKKIDRKPPPRPDAIVIARSGDMSYRDILMKVRKEENLQKLGENVTGIRKIAKGEMLLELKETQMESTSELRGEISKLLGDQAQIKALTHEVIVEIRDLDEITTKEDISEAIRKQVKKLNNFDDLPEEALELIVIESGNNNEVDDDDDDEGDDKNSSEDDNDHEYDYSDEETVYIF